MKGFYFNLMALPGAVRRMRALLLLLGVLGLAAVLTYWQMRVAPELALQRQQVQAEVAQLGNSSAPTNTTNPKELAQAWQSARSVSVQLGLPWQNFFVQLGNAAKSGHVALISIEPDAQKGHVVLVLEASGMETMLQFISELQASADFSEVVLQSHAINKNVPEKPVRFRVTATWRITE